MSSLYIRIMIAGVVVFVGGFMAIKYTFIDGTLGILPGLGLTVLGMGGGVALMGLGVYLHNRSEN